jgi:hypothetical protein
VKENCTRTDGGGLPLDDAATEVTTSAPHLQHPAVQSTSGESIALGVSGERSLTRPLRDARRFPSTRLYPVSGTTRTTLRFGICPSFKDHSLSRRAKPLRCDSQLFPSLYAGVNHTSTRTRAELRTGLDRYWRSPALAPDKI